MLTVTRENKKIDAVLLQDMIVTDGNHGEKGEVHELHPKDFRYLKTHGRVLEATKENVAEVKARIAAEKADAEKASKQLDEAAALRARVAQLEAQLNAEKGRR